MEKIKWYFKQMFPLTYWTTYGENGKRKITIWKMWLGQCYNINTFLIKELK
jgi:hypothetical protein